MRPPRSSADDADLTVRTFCSAQRRHYGHFGRAPEWSVNVYALHDDILKSLNSTRVDVHHDMTKIRLSKEGKVIEAPKGKDMTGEVERLASQKASGYCESSDKANSGGRTADGCVPGGTCYGGTPPTDGPNPGCCNSCEEVREAYVRRGWSFVNPDSVEQVSLDI